MRTLKELMVWGAQYLAENNIENSLFQARLLLQHVSNIDLPNLLKGQDQPLAANMIAEYQNALHQRASGKPFAYIVGYQEFYGLKFMVTPNVLVPRADSETLIDQILRTFAPGSKMKILDIGTGSGCLIISLLKNLPCASATAIDISAKALEVAKINAEQLGVLGRVHFLESDLLEALAPEVFDVIISNPPYICPSFKPKLAPEVLSEPHLALFADNYGLAIYEKIATQVHQYINCSSKIYLEMGYDQKDMVENIFSRQGFATAGVYKDLNSIDRCIAFYKL